MTTTTPPAAPRGSPAGMPAHLWELAKSDVRLSIPERVRNAVANGANAPEGVRRIAARVATTGAALGVPAALLAVGGFAGATTGAPVDLAGSPSPLEGGSGGGPPGGPDGGPDDGRGEGPDRGLDPAPAVPGSGPSGNGGGGGSGGSGDGGGFASTHTSGTGDVSSGLGTTWQVQEGGAEGGGDWLTVQMFQDVTVTETADGMFVVDAYQYIVIRDDDGNEYVFKEHYQVIVPDPPGEETDLVIHERGHVHVIENPDGSFSVATADFGIDVLVGSDGDGKDEVGITQSQRVQVTDREGAGDDDITVDLTESSVSTSEDTGDEATTTIDQDQVFTDRDLPPSPFGEGADATTTEGRGPFHPAGQGSGTPGTGAPGAGSPGGTGSAGTSGPVVVARPIDAGPLTSTLGAPSAAAAWHVETPEGDAPIVGAPSGDTTSDSPADTDDGTDPGTATDSGTRPGTDSGTGGAGAPFPGGTAPTNPSPFDTAPDGTPVVPGAGGTGTAGPPGSGTGAGGTGPDISGPGSPPGSGGTDGRGGAGDPGGTDGFGGTDGLGGTGGTGDPGSTGGPGDPADPDGTGVGTPDAGVTDVPDHDLPLDDAGADPALVS